MLLFGFLLFFWAQESQSLSALRRLQVLPLGAPTHHVQGIDTDGERLWVTSVDAPHRKGFLYEFSLAGGKLNRQIEIQDGERFHPGGISADETSLWIPIAEYRRNSTSIIQRRNKKTWNVELQFAVPDHIGCVAVTPDFVIGGNWDARTFYLWDHRGTLIRKVANATPNAYQDIKFHAGKIVAGGLLPGRVGAIDLLQLPSFDLVRRLDTGKTDRGVTFTREGMAIYRNQLLLLPEDNPSRLFVFEWSLEPR